MSVTFRPRKGTLLVSSTGRPVFMSTPVDQFIGTYAFASSTSPVARSIVYAKPLRSKWTSAFRVFPPIGRSTRMFSFTAS